MYRFTFLTIALFSVLISSSGLKAEVKNGEDKEIARVVVSEARLKTVPLEISDVGKMYAVDSVVLSFNIAEKINVIHFQDGDEVKQNQVVAELDSSIARTDVAKARSEFNLARNKLSRSQDMIDREPGSIPPQKIYELNELANLAKAELEQKKAILDNYRVLAPFSGRLADFKQSVGSYIESFDPLVTLYKRDPIEVFYSVSQDKIEEIALNQKVEIIGQYDGYDGAYHLAYPEYFFLIFTDNKNKVVYKTKVLEFYLNNEFAIDEDILKLNWNEKNKHYETF